ncbi:MAG: hypothetical protein IH595_03445 [Bacteroidales bacterium]|nr:hypothetical protein [Bacteroidales bacterium]
MRKLLFFIILILTFNLKASAQVAGISASKLTTFNAYTISLHHLEVEPSISWMSSQSAFNDHGKRHFYSANHDSLITSRTLFFRGTYSPFKNLEIGTLITSDLSSLSFGVKYLFFDNKKLAASFIYGGNWSGLYSPVLKPGFVPGPETRVSSYAGGFALTRQFSENLSWDSDLQYQNSFSGGRSFQNDYFVDSELGYYVFNHQLQLVGGFAYHYQNTKTAGQEAYSLIFNPGVTIETGKSYLIVLYAPIPLIGKNSAIYHGINLAFTMDVE